MNLEAKKRIEYIDLMKGICIITVILGHINGEYFNLIPGGLMLRTFRMPLYFFLSGLFFKQYSGFNEFFLRKFNKLIVPLFFFYCGAFLLAFVLSEIFGFYDRGWMNKEFSYLNVFDVFYKEVYFYNVPLWFLMALFETYLVYYLIVTFFNSKSQTAIIVCVSLLGWYLGRERIDLPYYWDTIALALPFFHLGACIKNTNIFEYNQYDKYLYMLILPVLVLIYLYPEAIDLLYCYVPPNYFWFYPAATLGIFAVFYFAKAVKYLPVISYIGKYSLIVLGTHDIVRSPITSVMVKIFGDSIGVYWAVLAVTLAIELALIPLMLRFFPQFTAQKDLIPVERILRRESIVVK